MSIEEYHKLSTPIDSKRVGWSVLFDSSAVLRDKTNLDKVLDQVKFELKHGNRLTMGFILPNVADGVVGALGSYHVQNDSWVLTSEIAEEGRHQTHFFGHEIIITGFDDNAVADGPLGERHKGLLTLRNSWGIGAGFQGDFYMSYDYFKAFVIEMMVIKDLRAISKAQVLKVTA
jgi:C1A family cysteine protease